MNGSRTYQSLKSCSCRLNESVMLASKISASWALDANSSFSTMCQYCDLTNCKNDSL